MIYRLLSLVGLVGIWWLIAIYAADPLLFPGPLAMAQLIIGLMVEGSLWGHLGATLFRVIAAFIPAMLIGSVIGYAMGRLPVIDRLLDTSLILLLNIPALVVIVLAYVWGGLNETSAIAAVILNKLPLVITIMREGTHTLDYRLDALARLYRMPLGRYYRHLVLPQMAPYFAVAARNGLALIWKIVLVVEFLGRPDGIGFQIHYYFQLFEMNRMLAYALPFVLIMLAVEYGVLQPLERRASRWRRVGEARHD